MAKNCSFYTYSVLLKNYLFSTSVLVDRKILLINCILYIILTSQASRAFLNRSKITNSNRKFIEKLHYIEKLIHLYRIWV